jgi:hypothetical protein
MGVYLTIYNSIQLIGWGILFVITVVHGPDGVYLDKYIENILRFFQSLMVLEVSFS